jgi:transposase
MDSALLEAIEAESIDIEELEEVIAPSGSNCCCCGGGGPTIV